MAHVCSLSSAKAQTEGCLDPAGAVYVVSSLSSRLGKIRVSKEVHKAWRMAHEIVLWFPYT